MYRRRPPPDNQPRAGPTPGTPTVASPAPTAADLLQRRQLEESVSWSGRERLRCLWYGSD